MALKCLCGKFAFLPLTRWSKLTLPARGTWTPCASRCDTVRSTQLLLCNLNQTTKKIRLYKMRNAVTSSKNYILKNYRCHKRQILWKYSMLEGTGEVGMPNFFPEIRLDLLLEGKKNAINDLVGTIHKIRINP